MFGGLNISIDATWKFFILDVREMDTLVVHEMKMIQRKL
jgi:hypothetical protein